MPPPSQPRQALVAQSAIGQGAGSVHNARQGGPLAVWRAPWQQGCGALLPGRQVSGHQGHLRVRPGRRQQPQQLWRRAARAAPHLRPNPGNGARTMPRGVSGRVQEREERGGA